MNIALTLVPSLAQIESYISTAKAKVANLGGFNITGWLVILNQSVDQFMRIAASLQGVDGAAKKELVIQAAERLFDVVSPYIRIPYLSAWIPGFVRTWVLAKIRAEIRPFLNSFIEQQYANLKSRLDAVANANVAVETPQPPVN
jgi:hypothetical protein